MNDGRHIIWTDYLDYDDWKEDFEAQYPELSENERMNLMYEINGTYFQDEKTNLDIQLSPPDSRCRGFGALERPPYGVQGNRKRQYPAIVFAANGILTTPLGMWIKTAIFAVRLFITTVQITTSTAPIRTVFPKRRLTI